MNPHHIEKVPAPDHPRERDPQGWFDAPKPVPPLARRVKSNEWVMHYIVTPNLLMDSDVAYREMTVWWTSATSGQVLAHGSTDLLGTHSLLSNDDLLASADQYTQSSFDLVDMLCSTYARPLVALLTNRRHIAYFKRLEVRAPESGRGLGAQLGAQLLALLRARFKAGVIVLKPFPLQYEGRLPDGSPLMPAFQRDRAKLAAYYARHWNAFPVPGNEKYQFAPGNLVRTPADIRVHAGRWSLRGRD